MARALRLTEADIRAVCPSANAKGIKAFLAHQDELDRYGISSSPNRMKAFMCNLFTEGQMRLIRENLNYSTPERLMAVWPKRFKTIAAARPYVKNPERLAELVYGGRKDLGNSHKGDGWKFRGGGWPQLTGRATYEAVQKETGVPFLDNPDATCSEEYALLAALGYWKWKGLQDEADRGDFERVRYLWNGGNNGMKDFKTYLARAHARWAFPEDAPRPRPKPVPVAAPVVTPAVVMGVQTRLIELGYRLGRADGKIGPLTQAAILAFRNEHGLATTPAIDDALLEALETARPRVLSPERETLTEKDLREAGSQTIKEADAIDYAAKGTMAVGGFAGAVKTVNETGLVPDGVTEAIQQGETMRTVAESISSLGQFLYQNWWVGALAAALFVWWYAKRIKRRRVEDARAGVNLGL